MPHFPKPFFRKARKAWFVQIDGRQFKLGQDRETAFTRYRELTGKPPRERPRERPLADDQVVVIFDRFLAWVERHRAPRTYCFYKERLQSFAKTLQAGMCVSQLKPYHVQEWLDQHPTWNDGQRRGCIMTVQRSLNWALRLGYIDRSPIAHMEKPRGGRREEIVTEAEYPKLFAALRTEGFRDLIVAAWETGARPQELMRVEARHVDLANSRWVFPPHEAKVKSRPRIVYLNDKALEITQRLMKLRKKGPLFRNQRNRPWVPWALNCQYQRLEQRFGKRICLYTLRHSFATRMLQKGLDALTVAILLGHANPAMLSLTYQHLQHNPQHLLEQVRKASG